MLCYRSFLLTPRLIYYSFNNFIADGFCPTVFDGWSCLNKTPAGEVANVSCPSFVVGFDPNSKYIIYINMECNLVYKM